MGPSYFLLTLMFFLFTDVANCSFVVFQIWDLPGHLDYFDSATFDANNIFGGCDALIFVIDAQVKSVYP